MSCGSPAGGDGFAPPLGQGGAAAQEMESFAVQIQAGVAKSSQLGATTVRFSASDYRTVAWTSGAVYDADGVANLVSSGNTGAMTTLTYIYLDLAVSATTLQATTNAANIVGAGRYLLAIAEPVADTTKLAKFITIGVPDFSSVWTGQNITANTLTAGHIASLVFTGKTANFDTGTVGGWTMASSELTSGNVKIKATAEQLLFGSATAPLTGTGIFLGKDGSDYEFRCGNPSTDYMHWDGSSLTVKVGNDVSVTGSGGTFGSFVRRTITGSGGFGAFQGVATRSTSDTSGSITGVEGWAQVSHSSGTVGQVFGMYATGRTSGAGTTTQVCGIRSTGSADSSGPVTSAMGLESYADIYSTGGVSSAYGVQAWVVARASSSGTIGFAASLYAGFSKDVSSTATITNAYGLYVADITGATTNYAIRTGLGKVDFGGAVTCSSTVDISGVLTTNSTMTANGAITVNANISVPGAFAVFYSTGNVALTDATGSFGGGTDVVFIGNTSGAPGSNPTGGGILYAEAGALKWRGSGGTVTTIANA